MSRLNQIPRRQYFVEPKVQLALIGKVVFYWVFCLLAVALILLSWQVLIGPTEEFYAQFNYTWLYFAPAALASLLLLPLVIIDIVQFSNRIVGPLVRLRRSIQALARGETVKLIEFRKNDFWRDFADEFNAIVMRIEKLQENQRTAGEIHDDHNGNVVNVGANVGAIDSGRDELLGV